MARTDLLREIAAMPTGPARQILITGEAGMGKSTVIDAAVSGFVAAGITVLRAVPSFAERYTAYSTLWDLVSDLDWTSLTTLPEDYKTFLDVATGLRPPTIDLPALATAIAFEDILAELASMSPVVLVIDDAQWVDVESRATVERAFRRSASRDVSLVAASRTGAGSASNALELGFATGDERVLEGLSVTELEGLVRSTWPSTLTRSQVRMLHEHTGGNPLWALELASSGDLGELGARAVGTVGVPLSLAGTIADRLRSLDPDTADVISVAALLGHPTIELLHSVVAFAGIRAKAVDDAESAGYLSVTTRTVRTRHPLYAAAASARLTPSRRRELHRFMADAVNEPVLRAQHLQQSRPSGPDEEIAVALELAAVLTHRRGARLRSAHFAGQAVDRTDITSHHYQTRVLDYAQHLFSAGDLASALSALESIGPGPLDLHQFDAYLALTTSALRSHRGNDAAQLFLRRQAEDCYGDASRSGVVDAHLAGDDVMPAKRRAELSSAALSALSDEDAPNAVHRAIRGRIRARLDQGNGLDSELVDDSTRRQSIQIVVGLDDTGLAATAYFSHLIDDVGASRLAFEQLVAWARSEGKDGIERTFLVQAAHVELTAGDLPSARKLVTESTLASDFSELPASSLPVFGLLLVAEEQHEELQSFVSRWRGSAVGSGLFDTLFAPALLGFSAFARDDWPVAIEQLRHAALAADVLQLSEPGSRFRVDATLIEALYRNGGTVEAGLRLEAYRSFLDRRDRLISRIRLHRLTSMRLASEGSTHAALSEADLAVSCSVDSNRAADEAINRLHRSRVLARLRRVTQSRLDLETAGERAGDSGDPGTIARVRTALARGRRSRSGSELTAAEQRVRAAVSTGQTNREIAADQFISIRTVESHVSAILRKTGATSRSKLRAQ